ncbi:hypothetical protein ACEPPN_005731 [Leptodophora sp. 'Broadleaf-Isolate-01']
MLRPMDIISLTAATGVKITNAEEKRHLVIWRQLFFDMSWLQLLKGYGCTVTIVGKDLGILHTALQSRDWRLDTSLLKLALVIGEHTSTRSYERCRVILDSFDFDSTWHETPQDEFVGQPFHIAQKVESTQVAIISTVDGTYAELHRSWNPALSQRRSSLRKFLVGAGKPYPSTMDVWESEWQQLEQGNWLYNPTRIHYIIQPLDLSAYVTRIYVNSRRTCCSILMKAFELGLEYD